MTQGSDSSDPDKTRPGPGSDVSPVGDTSTGSTAARRTSTEDEESPASPVVRFLRGKSEKGGRWPLLSVIFASALGALGGVGSFTFQYAEGLSYFKTDPEACVNCHIMQPEYDAWLKSSHHAVAVCVDCHLPHDFVPKYLAKAENGWRHGKLFTTGGFKEPIEVQELGQRILQQNCEHCHQDLVSEINRVDGVDASHPVTDYVSSDRPLGGQVLCVHCHSTVGHGIRAAVGGPLTDKE